MLFCFSILEHSLRRDSRSCLVPKLKTAWTLRLKVAFYSLGRCIGVRGELLMLLLLRCSIHGCHEFVDDSNRFLDNYEACSLRSLYCFQKINICATTNHKTLTLNPVLLTALRAFDFKPNRRPNPPFSRNLFSACATFLRDRLRVSEFWVSSAVVAFCHVTIKFWSSSPRGSGGACKWFTTSRGQCPNSRSGCCF